MPEHIARGCMIELVKGIIYLLVPKRVYERYFCTWSEAKEFQQERELRREKNREYRRRKRLKKQRG